MLAKVVTDADAVKALIPARIEEAKNAAVAAQTESKAAFDEAKALLESCVPKTHRPCNYAVWVHNYKV